MTVTNLYAPTRTVGNGVTTAFAFTFQITDETDIDVFLIDTGANTNKTVQTITTQYTVVINPSTDGGTITFVTAPPSTKDVILERDEDYTQTNDIPDVATIQESSIESPDDKNTRLIQQVLEITRRKIGLSTADDTLLSSFNYDIADLTSNSILRINSTGTGVGGTTLASLGAVGLPTTSGVAVYVGSDTFVAREIITSGSILAIDGKGLTGNITLDSTPTDNTISTNTTNIATNLASIVALQAAGLVIKEVAELSFSRAMDSTGSQTLAHGLSGTPLLLVGIGSANADEGGTGFGVCVKKTGAATFAQVWMSKNKSGTGISGGFENSLLGYHITAGGVSDAKGVVTAIDTTNITLTWTQNGSATDTIKYKVIAIV